MVRVFEILLSLRLGKCIQYKKQSKLMLTEMHLASYREYNRFPAHNSNMMWVSLAVADKVIIFSNP